MMLSLSDRASFTRLQVRHLTSLGNLVDQAVTAGAANIAITFPRAEGKASYGIVVTPNWNTTVWVTAKTINSCVVNFGTVAPGGATFDLVSFRTE